MPTTYWTFLFGTLALAGIFPLAGFWSKDEILLGAEEDKLPVHPHPRPHRRLHDRLPTWPAACYLTFHGEYRGHGHPHESPRSMTVPLCSWPSRPSASA